jgi:hypothetical protein
MKVIKKHRKLRQISSDPADYKKLPLASVSKDMLMRGYNSDEFFSKSNWNI